MAPHTLLVRPLRPGSVRGYRRMAVEPVGCHNDEKGMTMESAEYFQIQITLQQIAAVVAPLDLQGFLVAAGRAETLGPILDPTLYKAGCENLDKVKELAQAVQCVQRVAKAHAIV